LITSFSTVENLKNIL